MSIVNVSLRANNPEVASYTMGTIKRFVRGIDKIRLINCRADFTAEEPEYEPYNSDWETLSESLKNAIYLAFLNNNSYEKFREVEIAITDKNSTHFIIDNSGCHIL